MEKIDYKKIGLKLKKSREYLELTQEQVANILNVGRDAILRIEKGSRKITADELNNFSRLYKISIDELLDNTQRTSNEQVYARGFSKLCAHDQKEILDLIRLKNEYKKEHLHK